ncbi:ras gtpase-activating protein [Anaeramoeba flamelloides]|uniref:Ras gtpase-activating protein n=1 Tax=Anaeramoeba flamelloides TaxID=1746091 RepID=A0ABQ8Z292_9EUKA|nr:ras gtpase-activating protein [Anaeramoeba flamelloides]
MWNKQNTLLSAILFSVSRKKNLGSIDKAEIFLIEWVNSHISDLDRKIKDFSVGFKDCVVLANVLNNLSTKTDFLKVLEINDLKKRATELINLLNTSEIRFQKCTVTQIIEENKESLLLFIAKLFLWSQSDMKKKEKISYEDVLIKENKIKESEKLKEKEQLIIQEQEKEIEKLNQMIIEEKNMRKKLTRKYSSILTEDFEYAEIGSIDYFLDLHSELSSNFLVFKGEISNFFQDFHLLFPNTNKLDTNFIAATNKLASIKNKKIIQNPKNFFRDIFIQVVLFVYESKFSEKQAVLDQLYSHMEKLYVTKPIKGIEKSFLRHFDEMNKILKSVKINLSEDFSTYLSICTLYDQYFYSSIFRFFLTEIFAMLLQEHNFTNKNPEKTWKLIYDEVGRLIPGQINLKRVQTTIRQFFQKVQISNYAKNASKIIHPLQQRSLGKTLRILVERTLSYKSLEIHKKTLNQLKRDQSGKYDSVRKVLNTQLLGTHINYLIALFDPRIQRNFALPLSHLLFTLFDSLGMLLQLIHFVIVLNITNSDSIDALFEKNTICSILINIFFQKFGQEYLVETIGSVFLQIKNKKSESLALEKIESPPKKVIKKNIRMYYERFINKIFSTHEKVPSWLKIVLSIIKQEATKKYRRQVNSFLCELFFVRFFCPGITSSEIHQKIGIEFDQETEKSLHQVANLIQSFSAGTITDKKRENNSFHLNLIKMKFEEKIQFLSKISEIKVINFEEHQKPFYIGRKFEEDQTIEPLAIRSLFDEERFLLISPKEFIHRIFVEVLSFEQNKESFFTNERMSYLSELTEQLKEMGLEIENLNDLLIDACDQK